jgi:homoserine O-acetyltransferase/O-succinyltransferase
MDSAKPVLLMKKLIALNLLVVAFLAPAMFGQPAALTPERHEFVIPNFHTELGATLPEAHIVYGTYGHLNEAKDNAVLLPSHYMANLRGYEWLMGADKALDPSKLFLITTELFGNGRSSSPSNTAEPFHGPRFPVMTIRDNVQAVHKLLVEELKITHLKPSSAFPWARSRPFSGP